jgi:hypothetical protein
MSDTSRFLAPPPVVIPKNSTPAQRERLRFPVVPPPGGRGPASRLARQSAQSVRSNKTKHPATGRMP